MKQNLRNGCTNKSLVLRLSAGTADRDVANFHIFKILNQLVTKRTVAGES